MRGSSSLSTLRTDRVHGSPFTSERHVVKAIWAPSGCQIGHPWFWTPVSFPASLPSVLTVAAIGLLIGVLVQYFDVQPFIASLAGLFLARGLAFVVSLSSIRVEDPAAMAARAVSLGGKVLIEPRPDVRKGTLAVVTDPTGAALALQKWPL